MTKHDHAPALDPITALAASAEDLARRAAPVAAPVSTEEIRRLVKMRLGGEELAAHILTLAGERALPPAELTPAAALARLDEARRLDPVARRVATTEQALSRAQTRRRADVWSAAMYYYGILQKMAERDATLAADLAPVAAALAVGKHGSKERAVRAAAHAARKAPKRGTKPAVTPAAGDGVVERAGGAT